MIRVLLVDDHHMVRAGLRTLLESSGEVAVVGEAGDGEAAVAAVRELAPDVVLMDLSMPVMDGVAATRGILVDHPGTRIVVLTSFADRTRVQDAIRAGATGYVLKDCEPEELLAAVRAAARGFVPLDPRIAQALLPGPDDRHRLPGTPLDGLSPREVEVLRLVAEGMANKQVARRLGLSERTVKAHLGRVFRHVGVPDRTSAALWARDNLPRVD